MFPTNRSRALTLATKAYHYWRTAGTRALIRRVSEFRRAHAHRQGIVAAREAAVPSVAAMLDNRFRSLRPISVFDEEPSGRRITIITDSISKGSLFGGVGTALMLGALAAQRAKATLRIVTREEVADASALAPLLRLNGIAFDRPTDFRFLPSATADQLPVHSHDRFITTSWWTTEAARRLPSEQQFYLIQEDERMFYPQGDDLVRCQMVISDPHRRLIVNSKLLFEHLGASLGGLEDRGSYFEPAFPSSHFYLEEKDVRAKRVLFFYARPNNPRNLFYLGSEVLRRAVEDGTISPEKWRLVLCGKDIPRIEFSPAIETEYLENLQWGEYAAAVRKSDIGLSLMLTPHPSYPPLDLAASGAVVVTSTYLSKRSLGQYSENIIAADPDPEALLAALREATARVQDSALQRQRYEAAGMHRDWNEALAAPVDRIERSFD